MASSRSTPVFEIYKDKKGEYRWRARAKNGNLLASASEGYKDKRDAVHCAKLFGFDPKAVPPAPKKVKTAEAETAKPKKTAKKPAEAPAAAEAAPVLKPRRATKPKAAPAQEATEKPPEQA